MAKEDQASFPDTGQPEQPSHAANPLRLLIAVEPGSKISASGKEAIDFAVWLSRTVPVQVRAVGTFLRPWPVYGLSKAAGRYENWLQDQAEIYGTQIAKAFTAAGLEEEHWDRELAMFVDGPSESALLSEAAENFNADLVILGSAPAAPKGRFSPGSTTDALLHSSRHRLGLVPRAAKLSKKGVTRLNVALLTSEHEYDQEGLLTAARFADTWDVPLRLVAFSPMGLTGPSDSVSRDKDLHSSLDDEWHEYALGMLDRVRDAVHLTYESVHVDTEIAAGGGWSGAHDAVKWKKGDLLFLSTTPLGPIARIFVGSAEADFLRSAQVPVIVSATKPG